MTLRLLFVALCVSGCTASQAPRHASSEPAASSSEAPPRPTSGNVAPEAPGSVPVIVTGVLVRRDAVVEICPGSSHHPCAGIEVSGQVPEAWLSTPERVSVWHVSGRFDGSKLSPSGAEPSKLGDRPNYHNACPEFQKPMAGQNPDDRPSADVTGVLAEEAARVAGHWWDMQRQTMVISVKGDTADLTKRVRARFPKSRICIQQARFSERELEDARARADRILKEGGVAWSGSSIDVVQNRVVYDADVLDAPTLVRLRQETGDAVVVTAFIQLPKHALNQLPAAPKRGDVPLVTQTSRSAASMNALGRFSVNYDAALHCVYLQGEGGERLLPVWPFGYWAMANPLVIYDFDDQPVARPGQVVELGGGGVDVQHVKAPNSCGAKTAWIGAPQNVAARHGGRE